MASAARAGRRWRAQLGVGRSVQEAGSQDAHRATVPMLEQFAGLSQALVEVNEHTLKVDESPGLSPQMLQLNGYRVRELKTTGDGACAIHACFGETLAGSSVEHAQPRDWLGQVLPDSFDDLVRPIDF